MIFSEEDKDLLADMIREQYGFDIDVDDIIGETKLNEEDFHAKYQESFARE